MDNSPDLASSPTSATVPPLSLPAGSTSAELAPEDLLALQLIGLLSDVGDALHELMFRHVTREKAISNKAVGLMVTLMLDGPSRPSILSERLGISPSDVSKTINTLSREGLIQRQRHPNDGRGYLIHLTRRGTDLITDVMATTASSLENTQDLIERLDSFVARIRTTTHRESSRKT
jgi:DNA-binding MarR family transcriptional regulator